MNITYDTIMNTDLFASFDYDAIDPDNTVLVDKSAFTRRPEVGDRVALRDPSKGIDGGGKVIRLWGDVARIDIGWFDTTD